jgi:hypothetical protein
VLDESEEDNEGESERDREAPLLQRARPPSSGLVPCRSRMPSSSTPLLSLPRYHHIRTFHYHAHPNDHPSDYREQPCNLGMSGRVSDGNNGV